MKAQVSSSDDLGWALDKLVEHSPKTPMCPKGVARAHARLIKERAERDDLRAEVESLRAELEAEREKYNVATQPPCIGDRSLPHVMMSQWLQTRDQEKHEAREAIETLRAEVERLSGLLGITQSAKSDAAEAGEPEWRWHRHGDGWALMLGATPSRHGLNKLTVPDHGFDWGGEALRETIARLLNEQDRLVAERLANAAVAQEYQASLEGNYLGVISEEYLSALAAWRKSERAMISEDLFRQVTSDQLDNLERLMRESRIKLPVHMTCEMLRDTVIRDADEQLLCSSPYNDRAVIVLALNVLPELIGIAREYRRLLEQSPCLAHLPDASSFNEDDLPEIGD